MAKYLITFSLGGHFTRGNFDTDVWELPEEPLTWQAYANLEKRLATAHDIAGGAAIMQLNLLHDETTHPGATSSSSYSYGYRVSYHFLTERGEGYSAHEYACNSPLLSLGDIRSAEEAVRTAAGFQRVRFLNCTALARLSPGLKAQLRRQAR